MRFHPGLATRALGRRDGVTPRYGGPLGLWRVLGLALLLAWMLEIVRPLDFLLLAGALVGWAAPVAAARYGASATARERELGSMALLVAAAGPGAVFLGAVAVSSVGPLLEVVALAAVTGWYSGAWEAVAMGGAVLGLQVLAAGAVGAWVGAGSATVREALQRVALGPVALYLGALALLVGTEAHSGRSWEPLLAAPPFVLPCTVTGCPGMGLWAPLAGLLALVATAFAGWRFLRVRD